MANKIRKEFIGNYNKLNNCIEFGPTFIKNLSIVFPDGFTDSDTGYMIVQGTAGWQDALITTLVSLGLKDVLSWYRQLDFETSEDFDLAIEFIANNRVIPEYLRNTYFKDNGKEIFYFSVKELVENLPFIKVIYNGKVIYDEDSKDNIAEDKFYEIYGGKRVESAKISVILSHHCVVNIVGEETKEETVDFREVAFRDKIRETYKECYGEVITLGIEDSINKLINEIREDHE